MLFHSGAENRLSPAWPIHTVDWCKFPDPALKALRSYGGSEVIQQSGGKSQSLALERERTQIVNNLALSASPGL
jgi:hypothetical protein